MERNPANPAPGLGGQFGRCSQEPGLDSILPFCINKQYTGAKY